MAVEDLGSKPMIKVSIGTKIPPPPTPPTLPKAAPKNPTIDPIIIFQPNFISCSNVQYNACQSKISISIKEIIKSMSKVLKSYS